MVGAYCIRPTEWPRRGQKVARLVAFCRSRPLAGTFGGAYAIRPYPDGRKTRLVSVFLLSRKYKTRRVSVLLLSRKYKTRRVLVLLLSRKCKTRRVSVLLLSRKYKTRLLSRFHRRGVSHTPHQMAPQGAKSRVLGCLLQLSFPCGNVWRAYSIRPYPDGRKTHHVSKLHLRWKCKTRRVSVFHLRWRCKTRRVSVFHLRWKCKTRRVSMFHLRWKCKTRRVSVFHLRWRCKTCRVSVFHLRWTLTIDLYFD